MDILQRLERTLAVRSGRLAAAARFALAVLLGVAGLAERPAEAQEMPVDVELVLAVDISYSMDEDEQRLQRQGYADALVSPEVQRAIQNGNFKRVAIAYVEWAGATEQRLVLDWALIDGLESARAFAGRLLEQPYRRAYRTSISGGLIFSAPLFEKNNFRAERQVIDMSGDGANNQGVLVEAARDDVVKRGIVINGLPIMIKRPNFGYMDIAELDQYYEDCVIGGEGSFVVPIKTREMFGEAIRMKLIMEIAGLAPPGAPATRFGATDPPAAGSVRPVAGRANPLCMVGERLWQERNDWMRN